MIIVRNLKLNFQNWHTIKKLEYAEIALKIKEMKAKQLSLMTERANTLTPNLKVPTERLRTNVVPS